MARYRNVCFTLNNPEELIEFDEERMQYLIYQEEIGASGTYHLQGYCEFKDKVSLNPAKAMLGGDTVHLEPRHGTAEEAAEYCRREFETDGTAKRIPFTEVYEWGEPKQQGKRQDLKAFKDAVMAGGRRRDLMEDHFSIFCRFPKFYDTLNSIIRPERSDDNPLRVTLHYGPTGLGKTRTVMDQYAGNDEFWTSPLANTIQWYDTYDGHKFVLLDDFTGASSHMALCTLLRLLDRYAVLVPVKGSHTWWLPSEIYLTTNILPKDWYKWEGRGEQYKALARRIHRVKTFWEPIAGMLDQGYQWETAQWWIDNKPDETFY